MRKYKKHLKNVGPIRHCEPPHAHSPGVATVARRLRIDVHDNDDDDNDQQQRQRQRVTEGTAMAPYRTGPVSLSQVILLLFMNVKKCFPFSCRVSV